MKRNMLKCFHGAVGDPKAGNPLGIFPGARMDQEKYSDESSVAIGTTKSNFHAGGRFFTLHVSFSQQ
jgi:hypothetical protein